MQAAAVELIRRDVRRGCESHAAREQPGEQAAEQHRVRDVGHGELVEADDARVRRDFLRHELERVLDVAMALEPLVHVRHEAMKVLAPFVGERKRAEE